MFKKVILLIVIVISILASLYSWVPSFRHFVYYYYYIWIKHPEVAGGPCGPNCNGYNEYEAYSELNNVDTLPLFNVQTSNRLMLTGVVYDYHGKPASDVILYVFHTDSTGVYPKRPNATGAEKINGYVRGWIKTGEDGRYVFYANRPAAYPDGSSHAHIHCVVKEPDVNVYTVPDYVFDDDPDIKEKLRTVPQTQNGGLIKESRIDGVEFPVYVRDIYLGRNIVNYPKNKKRP